MNLKMVVSIASVLLILTSAFGIIYNMAASPGNRIGRFYNELPILYNGIAVDSMGNIYIGIRLHNAIQVYDNTGMFLYHFSFPSNGGGVFAFYIDENDIVHVAVARGVGYLAFYNGRRYGERRRMEPNELREFDSRRVNTYVDIDGNTYIVARGRVRMYDEQGYFIRSIFPGSILLHLLNPYGMFLLFLVGVIVLAVANITYLVKFIESSIAQWTRHKGF